MTVFCFFFFFQAEDGIRDRDVTGVQTCALPISGGFEGEGQRASTALDLGGALAGALLIFDTRDLVIAERGDVEERGDVMLAGESGQLPVQIIVRGKPNLMALCERDRTGGVRPLETEDLAAGARERV